MTIKLSWRQRSVVLLTGVILILGFILTTLVVREAEMEKLAREKDLTGEQRRFAALLTGEIDSLFLGIEEKVTAALADSQTQQEENKLLEACRRLAEAESLIGDIFLAGANGELAFPLKNPRALLSERRRLARDNLKRIESYKLFKTAESAELTTRNLPLAIQSYKSLMNQVPDDSTKALILNRLGRCYLKSGNLNLALRAYNQILKTSSNEMSSDGVPLGIIAFFQIGNITLKTETEKAEQIILEFYGRLLGNEWPLDKSQFQFYRNIINKMHETWKNGSLDAVGNVEFQNRWDEFEMQADAKFMDLGSEEILSEKIIPLVQARVFEFNSRVEEFSRFSENVGDTLFLISTSSIQGDKIIGILMDDSVLAQKRLPLILDRLPIPEDWLVQIVDDAGRIIYGEAVPDSGAADLRPPFVLGFDQNFPPWQVRIFLRYPGALDRRHNSRRNVYILAVLVVMAVLFFGGFIAIRSTAKELELARLKSEFVSTVSHELRTPLMSIRYLSELLDSQRVKSEDKKKVYYGKINKESERLSRLIENMLDFSKIEAGVREYQFEYLSIKNLVKDVADRFREYVVNKPVTLECEISDHLPYMHVDREAISRALFNLLDNAVKYSGKNPVIHIRARYEEETVLLEIQDMGIGIRRDDHKKVFEKFYRSLDPAHRNIEGSGIGLTLVDHIVKAHGGKVFLESSLGEGTRVTLILPVTQKGKEHG